MALQLAPSVGTTTIQHSTAYEVTNLNATVHHDAWHATLYCTNLFDRKCSSRSRRSRVSWTT